MHNWDSVCVRSARSQDRAMPTCLFCANPSGNREHILPQWLLRSLAPDLNGRLPATAAAFHQRDGTSSVRALDTRNFVTKDVCGRCNTGWMADLENDTIPTLKPLIEMVDSQFSSTALESLHSNGEKLALWMAKTALLASHALPHTEPLEDIIDPLLLPSRKVPLGVWLDVATVTTPGDFGACVGRQFLVANETLEIERKTAVGVFQFCLQANQVVLRLGRCPGARVDYFGNQGHSPIRIFPLAARPHSGSYRYANFNQFVGSVLLTELGCPGEVSLDGL